MRDKAYYPVRYNTDTRSWVPDEFTLDRLCLSSIQPTPDQMKKFEQSSAYLAMIYSVSVHSLSIDNTIRFMEGT